MLYILANIAYFAAVPKADVRASTQIAASLFFTAVFGSSNAVKGLNFLIALSSFGNLVAVLLGQPRLLRECGRYEPSIHTKKKKALLIFPVWVSLGVEATSVQVGRGINLHYLCPPVTLGILHNA